MPSDSATASLVSPCSSPARTAARISSSLLSDDLRIIANPKKPIRTGLVVLATTHDDAESVAVVIAGCLMLVLYAVIGVVLTSLDIDHLAEFRRD